jgi:hypothetical protein
MKKLVVVRYLAYITFILITFSILSGEAFAAKSSPESGDGNQYADENTIDTENYINSSEETNSTESSSSESVKEKDRNQIRDRDKYTAYKLERKQIQEDLHLQKSEYREAKGDFLKVRNQIQTGKLNPGSEEAIDATKVYLNSSISYMIAHLKNVKTNMQYSNGNGTEEKIAAIDESIKQLEAEQAAVEDASSQKELITSVISVRGIWTSAQKASLAGAGQIVSQKIGEFLDKSENLSEGLEVQIHNLNETGVNTADLQTRLASYNLYITAAQEKKAAADYIYEDENSTKKDLEVANNYLRESLNNANKANQILKVIFDELKEHGFKEVDEVVTEDEIKTELNKTELNNTISTN